MAKQLGFPAGCSNHLYSAFKSAQPDQVEKAADKVRFRKCCMLCQALSLAAALFWAPLFQELNTRDRRPLVIFNTLVYTLSRWASLTSLLPFQALKLLASPCQTSKNGSLLAI